MFYRIVKLFAITSVVAIVIAAVSGIAILAYAAVGWWGAGGFLWAVTLIASSVYLDAAAPNDCR